jgi:tetratricopeptide (TPR) repeat protein/mono/diheme cytochrome c family protein
MKSFALFLAAIAGLRAAAPVTVTFNRQIAPIIYGNCAPCHRPGEAAPFSLLSYQDARKHADQIADVTKRRFMPPWLPQHGYGEFLDERRLTEAQIQLLQRWAQQGAPEGASKAPAPPQFSDEWQMGTPDLILRAAQPYQLASGGAEVFWNFILPVPITTTRWVRAIEVRPGNPRVFHHANVILDRSQSSRRHEAAPGAGFPGMDLSVEEETFDPDGHFLSWKPGSEPVVEPEGMAWRAEPGMDLILNVHLRPSGKAESISPTIGLYFTDKPQSKFPMLLQLEHDGSIDIPPGAKDFTVTDEFRCPMDLKVLAVYPHAHYLGKLMEGYATLPNGKRQWLVRIPDWDLSWQGVYRLKAPLILPRGTLISMRYQYDNSTANVRNPHNPPQRVKAGNQAMDEMGHLWLQVVPAGEGDQRAPLQLAVVQQRLEKYPDDFSANYTMGDLLLTQGNAKDAVKFFAAAAKTQPGSVVAATELGTALFSSGQLAEAEESLKRAISLDPGYIDARFNLASVEGARSEWEAAANDFKQVLTARPENAKALQHLGEVLAYWGDELGRAGKHQEALLRYREALDLRPNDAHLHGQIGMELAAMARLDEAQQEFERALRIDPKSEPARQWMEMLKTNK